MLVCCSTAHRRASASSMSMNVLFCAKAGRIFLTTRIFSKPPTPATRARQTSAMPPRPMRSSNSNRPNIVPKPVSPLVFLLASQRLSNSSTNARPASQACLSPAWGAAAIACNFLQTAVAEPPRAQVRSAKEAHGSVHATARAPSTHKDAAICSLAVTAPPRRAATSPEIPDRRPATTPRSPGHSPTPRAGAPAGWSSRATS